jgi:hypothetical protein
MWRIIRSSFGALIQEPPDDATPTAFEAGLPFQSEVYTIKSPIPGKHAPLEVSQNSADKFFRDFFNEDYAVLVANDGHTALFSPCTLISEEVDGTVIFDGVRVDDDDPRDRIEPTIRIYEHLAARGPLKPRMAEYLGTTTTGYRLERVAYSSVDLELPCPYHGMNMAVLGLYQRWALQMLSGLQYSHANNVFMNNVGCDVWLRQDLSIAIPNMTYAGCVELEIPERTCPSTVLESPWADVGELYGSVKNDLFDWASWIFGLMTDKEDLLSFHQNIENAAEDTESRYNELTRKVACGEFDAWPQLDDGMLGSVIVKAWRGKYDSVDQAMQDAQKAIRACGHRVIGKYQDEVEGYDWEQVFEVTNHDRLGTRLRLRVNSKL